ncbi:MAG: Rne/Rng family ribonuclease [Myxococcota bacterium]
MGEKLLINVSVEETRLALVESGVLSNLEIDTARLVEAKGNIYKGVVHRVNGSLQAAFVDYGVEKQGFLPASEIHDRYFPSGKKDKKVPIQDLLREGQELMVQVVKDEIGSKGASLTTFPSLPGRYMVIMPDSGKTGISRRVPGPERNRLKKIVDGLDIPEDFGVIVRTAGVDRSKEELAQDLEFLKRLWESLEKRFESRPDAGLIHRERSAALRFIRDYATEDLDEIIVDEVGTYEEVRDFCTVLVPEMKKRVRYYDDPTPLFSRYQVEDQIDDVFARKIDLPSGGSIVIDQTEALVAIDVNSGRVKGGDIEETALTTNLEAATEVARQLKLRDRGGLVVVDFIDMRSKDNTRKVEQAARDAFAGDKAKVKFSRISEFGLMEISRQRLKSALMKGSFDACSHCGGTGQVRSVESSALYVLRRVKEAVLRGTNYMHASAQAPVPVANYLVNRKRAELSELERQSGVTIDVEGVPTCPPNRAYVEILASSGGRGRRARRLLLAFDLVRSDVEKRELDDVEDVLVEAAKTRGVSLTDDEYDHLYRSIQAKMAEDAEVVAAQREAQEKAARTRSDLDRKRLATEQADRAEANIRAEAERRVAEELQRQAEILRRERSPREEHTPKVSGGIVGFFRKLLTGEPVPAAEKARPAESPRELPPPSEKGDRRGSQRRKASGGGSGGGRRGGQQARRSKGRTDKGGDDAKEGSRSGGEQKAKGSKPERPPKEQGQGEDDKPKRKRRRRRRRKKKPQGQGQDQKKGQDQTQKGGASGSGKQDDGEKKTEQANKEQGKKTETQKAEPNETQQKKTGPNKEQGKKTETQKAGPNKAQQEKTEPNKGQGKKTETQKAEPNKAQQKKTEPNKGQGKKTETQKAGPNKAQQKKTEPNKGQGKKTEQKRPEPKKDDRATSSVPKTGVIDLRSGKPRTRPSAPSRPKAANRPDEKKTADSTRSSKE